MIKLKMKVLENGKGLDAPAYKTAGAAALDLAAATTATLFPGQVFKMPTGLAFAIPSGHVGLIKSRSSMNLKGIRIDGVIDADYRGEVFLICMNVSKDVMRIDRGTRIAQMLIQAVPVVEIEQVEELDATERGAGGFGSTGA